MARLILGPGSDDATLVAPHGLAEDTGLFLEVEGVTLRGAETGPMLRVGHHARLTDVVIEGSGCVDCVASALVVLRADAVLTDVVIRDNHTHVSSRTDDDPGSGQARAPTVWIHDSDVVGVRVLVQDSSVGLDGDGQLR